MKRYYAWLSRNVGEDNGYGRCYAICQSMKKEFPELELRKGQFLSDHWGKRGHWWLRTSEGRIIDPTARQHPDGVNFPQDVSKYEDLTDKTDKELMEILPTGSCHQCGSPVYKQEDFCSDKCRDATLAYLNSCF